MEIDGIYSDGDDMPFNLETATLENITMNISEINFEFQELSRRCLCPVRGFVA